MGSFGATENTENHLLYLAKSRFFSGMDASQPRASYSASPVLVPWPKVVPRAPPRAWAIRRHPQSRRPRSWVTANYRLRRPWSLLYGRFGSKIVPHPHLELIHALSCTSPHCLSPGEVLVAWAPPRAANRRCAGCRRRARILAGNVENRAAPRSALCEPPSRSNAQMALGMRPWHDLAGWPARQSIV